ncbi:hypothetical protein BGZ67_005739 [Mortierella alpina]|nr:hypothetical protein BGZ67_005739 [Mortierella alpina]
MSGEEANSVHLQDPLQATCASSKETARSQGRTPSGSSSNSNSSTKDDNRPEGSEDKQSSDHPLSTADPTVRPHDMHHPLSFAADQGRTPDHHAAPNDVKGTKNARLGIRAHGSDRAGLTDSSTLHAASKSGADSASPLAHLQAEPSATPSTTLAKTADLQWPPVTTTRAVSASASPLLLEPAVEATPLEKPVRQRPTPRHSSTAPPPSSQSRQQPLEHLTDMGPLEIERAIDSGVHWELGSSATPELPLPAEPSALPRQLLHRPSTSSSTVLSDSSRSSSTKVDPLSTTDNSDQSSEAGSLTWRGAHPLLLGYTAEPDIMDEEDATVGTASRDRDQEPRLRNRQTSLRHKGHSMSVDNHQGSISRPPTEITFPASGPGARRRRNISKEAEDKDTVSYRGKSQVHSRAATEAAGKRVIIHQVCITDTLAGIALYYGTQVTVLKKCNKLWTNDSIHTRKYLYIPFEECTVARQAGVTIDESNHTVILPQRVQQNHHTRSGSLVPQSSHQEEHGSSFIGSIAETNGNTGRSGGDLPDTQPANGGGHIASGPPGMENSMSPPPISAVAAGMLPSSSSSAATPSPRLGTWNDPKSMVAPPLSSHAVTTTTLKADSRMGSSALTPRRANTFTSGARPASAMAPLSENLPDIMVVSPSMTHEALAARFKEMDLVSTEQQNRKSMALGQELRINPTHHRHRTTDLRQYAHLQKQPQKQADSARTSRSSSNAGSRRASSDVGPHETMASGVGALATTQVDGRHGGKGNYHAIEEEDDADQSQQQRHDKSTFVTYGHHQHFYETDDAPDTGRGVGGREGLEPQSSSENGTTMLRRQELVTVPSGMLSFFPSPEHSKKLETPQSIARLPDRTDSYHSSSWSSSSTSSGSFRSLQNSQNGTPRTRGNRRAALGDQTFQPPTASESTRSGSSSHPPKLLSHDRRTVPSSAAHPAAVAGTDSGTKAAAHSKSVRVHQPYYGAQRWSLMGESLVDELLGAVRGPLQIARRMYNFTTHGFGTVLGGGNGGGKDADFDPPGLLRRSSSSARKPRSQRSREYRHSGVAIELDQTHTVPAAFATTTTTATAIPSVTTTTAPVAVIKRSPVVTVVETPLPEGGTHRSSRRKNGSTGGHGRASSTGSTHSARKRSLRSSHPVNHAALMALVNELDKDKKEQDKKEANKEKNPTAAGPGVVGSPSPVVDILATSL